MVSHPMPSWKPADHYDPDAFYTEASDKKGRGEPVQARVPPQIQGGIAALVQSGNIPSYQTQSDFIRNALVHQLHRDAERVDSGELRRIVSMVTLLNNEIKAAREKDDFQQLMSLIDARHQDYLSAGKMEEAKTYLKTRLSEVDALPERFQDDYDTRLSAKLYPM